MVQGCAHKHSSVTEIKMPMGFHGPSNPQLGHLYAVPVFLHLAHRQITTAPHFGQRNLVPFSISIMGVLQDVHIGSNTSCKDCEPGISVIYQ